MRERCGADIRPLVDAGKLLTATEYLTAQRSVDYLRRTMTATMARFDMLLLPATPDEARPHGAPEEESYEDQFAALANVSGFPAVSFPVGRYRSGLPLGLQLIGRPRRDEELLSVVAAYEDKWPSPASALASTMLS